MLDLFCLEKSTHGHAALLFYTTALLCFELSRFSFMVFPTCQVVVVVVVVVVVGKGNSKHSPNEDYYYYYWAPHVY